MLKYFIIFSLLAGVSFSSESDVYEFGWLDPDKEVYVLQNRKYRKKNKLFVGLNGSKTASGAFFDSYGVGLRGGYFFLEEWGFELAYEKHQGKTNSNYEGVDDQSAIAFYRAIDSYTAATVLWAPFYAKINTFNKIFYYDWIFGFGLANVTTSDNRLAFGVNDSDDLTVESNSGITWSTGLRFYLSETFSLRLDIQAIHFQASIAKQDETQDDELKKSWFHNYDMNLGLNISF